MPTLLVVHHSPTPSMRRLTDAVIAGANDDQVDGVDVLVKAALEASAADVLAADAYLLGTPANFGYMSGAMKHFFDSTFIHVGGSLADDGAAATESSRDGKPPFGLFVHGRYDTTGAVRSVMPIAHALGWRQSSQTLEVLGEVTSDHESAAYDLGGTIAALLAAG